MSLRNLTLFVSLVSCTLVFGQNSKTALLSNAAVHVLYRGQDNPVQVCVPAVSHEALSIECDAATVRKDAKQHLWYIMPTDSADDRLTLKVFKSANGQKVLLKEQICAIVNPPAPTITGLRYSVTRTTDSGNTSTQSFTISDMKKVPRKALLNSNAELMLDYPAETMKSEKLTIHGFSAQIRQTKYECVGNRFSEDAKKAMTQLKSGDVVSITDISATDEAGKNVPAATCTIIIR